MLRPRSAILVVVVGLLAWVTVTYFTSGRDLAATHVRIGVSLAETGLPSIGSVCLSRAADIYRARAKGDDPGGSAARLLECELTLARVFRERHNFQRARYYYERARSVPGDVGSEPDCRLAYLDGLDETPGARAVLLTFYEDEPENPLPAYLVGLLFMRDSQHEKSRTYLEQALARPEGDTSATRAELATVCEVLGDKEAAVEHARKSLDLARTPTEKRSAALILRHHGVEGPSPWGIWAETFVRRHATGLKWIAGIILALFYPTFLALLARVLPSVAARLYLLAKSAAPSAIAAYEGALKRTPNSVPILRALAQAYDRVGVGATRSAELYERLAVLRPDDREVRDGVVRLALECGRETNAAVEACRSWFDEHPEDEQAPAVAAHLGRAYRLRGERAPEEALAPLRLAAKTAPNDRELQHYVGALAAHYAYNEEAAAIFGRLLEADPQDNASRVEYARARIGSSHAYEAFRHLRALPPSPDVTIDMYLAGVVAQDAGRNREATRILQEVMRRDSGLFDVRDRLASVSAREEGARYGPYEVRGTLAAHEAYVLHQATHPEQGEVLLLTFRRDVSDALGFPEAFERRTGQLRETTQAMCPIVDVGIDEEAYYVAYKPPAGEPLSTVLEREGTLPHDGATRLLGNVAAALAMLHEVGELHGDLRPSNIWVDEAGEVTLVAAGMAEPAEVAETDGPPTARSPHHVAPEAVQRQEVGPEADVYSAGCVLYQMLAGVPPFEGPTHLATMMAHVTLQAEPLGSRVPALPSELEDIVDACLAKNPGERYANGGELAAALEELLAVQEATEEEPEAPQLAVPTASGRPGLELLDLRPRPPSPGGEPPDPNRWWTFYDDTVLVASARYAKVYRGFHRQTGEPHAVKHVQPPRPVSTADDAESDRSSEAVRRLFRNEMHLLQTLSEEDPPVEGIVTMLQAYRGDGSTPAYAMPLLGETLEQQLIREGPLPEDRAVAIAAALCRSLAALHERGIVHRNVSPRCVMFARDRHPYLGGFDRVCRLEERGPMLLAEREIQAAASSPLDVLGDVRFLSPEACRGDEFDQRSDVYSLGCLLYTMLAGAPPFDSDDAMQVMLHHATTPPPDLRALGLPFTANTPQVVTRALAKSPQERHESAAKMLEALTGGEATLRWQGTPDY